MLSAVVLLFCSQFLSSNKALIDLCFAPCISNRLWVLSCKLHCLNTFHSILESSLTKPFKIVLTSLSLSLLWFKYGSFLFYCHKNAVSCTPWCPWLWAIRVPNTFWVLRQWCTWHSRRYWTWTSSPCAGCCRRWWTSCPTSTSWCACTRNHGASKETSPRLEIFQHDNGCPTSNHKGCCRTWRCNCTLGCVTACIQEQVDACTVSRVAIGHGSQSARYVCPTSGRNVSTTWAPTCLNRDLA